MVDTEITWRFQMFLLAITDIYLLHLHASTAAAAQSTANYTDFHALLSFKSLVTDDPSGTMSSWITSSDDGDEKTLGFCRWKGVACGNSTADAGRVTSLRLRGLGLAGSISPELGNLTRLRDLDLSDNKLQGEIPPNLGISCVSLRSINLSVNSLSGTIPWSIGHLPELTVFSVRHNRISGSVPASLHNLTALTVLSISDNHVHGRIPPWIGNLTSLTDLNIACNVFHGNVPSDLARLPNLLQLAISENNLQGVLPPALFNISSLRYMYVGENMLSGSLPLDIGAKLPNLVVLSTIYNQFGGLIPASLSNISTLERLQLHGNKFHGRIPPNIGSSGTIKSLNLGNNILEANTPNDWDFLTSLTNCSQLAVLDLQLNKLAGFMPSNLVNLSQELVWIGLGGNQIAGTIPAGIGRFHQLTVLELADNIFAGSIPSDIGQLSNLHRLSLFQNNLSGEIPPSVGNLTQLNDLVLFSNYLHNKIPVTLGNLSKINSVDLSYNLLSGQIPEEVMRMSSLTKMLNLSNNMLSGPISSEIQQLVNLGAIDLSKNKLSGEIPHALGSCVELQFLYLQANLLQGKIPSDLSTLRGLEVIDISNNNLSGPIPEFLENFQGLKSLNLSLNNLSGPVPTKGIFSNPSTVSLSSNGILCGGPVLLGLPECTSVTSHNRHSQHRVSHILISCIVGGSIIFTGMVTFYFMKKRGMKPRDIDHQEHVASLLCKKYPRISYTELYAATNSFSSENLLGRGSFGSVYKGKLTFGENFVTVAVKVFDLRQRGATRGFFAECNTLRRIQHRKLVKVVTVCDSLDHNGEEFKAIVLEFISNGSLDTWLTTGNVHGTLSLMQRLNIALDVAEALDYLHNHIEPPIVHCDIKPSNILLDEDMVAHVSDFGLAKIMNVEASGQRLAGESTSHGIKGTIGYLPPEYGMGAEISVKGDAYSYGVLLLQMITGKQPTDSLFDGTTSLQKYVEMAYPDRLSGIIDAAIADSGAQEVIDLFIAPVARIGVACCSEIASQRMKFSEVAKELVSLKEYEDYFFSHGENSSNIIH